MMFAERYNKLKSSWKNSWHRFILGFSFLGQLLNQEKEPTPEYFLQIYFSSGWFTRFCFKSLFFNQSNDFGAIFYAIDCLKKFNLDTEENKVLVCQHQHISILPILFNSLEKLELLTEQFLLELIADKSDLVFIFYFLKSANNFTKETIDFVISHPKQRQLGIVFVSFYRFDLLSKENCSLIMKNQDFEKMQVVIQELDRAKILNAKNIVSVLSHQNLPDLHICLWILNQVGGLNEINLISILEYQHLHLLKLVLYVLMTSNMLNQVNLSALLECPNLEILLLITHLLTTVNLFNLANFNALIHPRHRLLCLSVVYRFIWLRIPENRLTQENFERIITLCEQENDIVEIIGFVQGLRQEEESRTLINPPQSTHTTSVNYSVSASALILMGIYGQNLNFDQKIEEIKIFIDGLESSLKHNAAKALMQTLTNYSMNYIDSSGISFQQLLVLSFVALNDHAKINCSIQNAQILFIEALYEIQRGYNLDQYGIDNGFEDSSICEAGAFHKLIEKLSYIHVDVKLDYMTHELAYLKFPKLANFYASLFLENLSQAKTAKDYIHARAIQDKLRTTQSLEYIWDSIKAQVTTVLFDEFKLVYANDSNHPKFLELVSYGNEIALTCDLNPFEQRLNQSSGFMAYLEKEAYLSLEEQPLLLSLATYGFWQTRNTTPEAQHRFDMRYGLTLLDR